MAWIESHQELLRHPKTKKLARKLAISVPAAVGHLHCLWWWAMDYAQEGNLSQYEPDDIADAMMWEGEPEKLIDALVEAGFLERIADALHIHDWDEYAGRLIDKRKQNAERKKRSRGRHADVTQDENDGHRATQPNPTEPNTTIPNPTTPPSETDAAVLSVTKYLLSKLARTALTATDNKMIKQWVDDGIPLEIIIQGIDVGAENFKPKYDTDKIRSLKWFDPFIQEIHHGKAPPGKLKLSKSKQAILDKFREAGLK